MSDHKSIRKHEKRNTVWLWCMIPLITVLLLVLGGLYWYFQDWLRTVPSGSESGTTTLRNLGLFIAALFALILALWRGIIANHQAEAAQEQVEIARLELMNERYQKGAEMLGNDTLPVCLGGIYGLARLASGHSEEYHVLIMRLFCASVRRRPTIEEENKTRAEYKAYHEAYYEALRKHPLMKPGDSLEKLEPLEQLKTKQEKAKFDAANAQRDLVERNMKEKNRLERVTTEAIMAEIVQRSDAQIRIERKEKYTLDLSEANLTKMKLCGANLYRADLYRADLYNGKLVGANLGFADLTVADLTVADLTQANLTQANLTQADLTGADLTGANLSGTILSNTVLSYIIGLTQEQLNEACADSKAPLKLDNALDCETNKQLVWHGGQLDDEG